jgi:hypothetical protein
VCRAQRYDDARRRAQQLFLLRQDVPAALVLLVAVTGLNIETVKELPPEHEVIEHRAVRLRVIKRRRGAGAWWRTVTWEIGPPGRELHHPGGIYLLLHRLMARGRELAGEPESFWSFWRLPGNRLNGQATPLGNPFRISLTAGIDNAAWAPRRDPQAAAWHRAHRQNQLRHRR